MSLLKTIWKQVLLGVGVVVALFVGLEVKRKINIRKRTKAKRDKFNSIKKKVKSDIKDTTIARNNIDGRVKANKDKIAILEGKKKGLQTSYKLIENKEKELEKEEQEIGNSIDYLKSRYGV